MSAEPVTHPIDTLFRTPDDFRVSDVTARRALVIGQCSVLSVNVYIPFVFSGIQSDHILYGLGGKLPNVLPAPLDEYDFQVIYLPLRTMMPEQLYFRLGYNDLAGYEAAFADSEQRLYQYLQGSMAYRERRALLTFVVNLPVPQQNPVGRLMPRYDLRNPVYYVEMLNRRLVEEVSRLSGVYVVDADAISSDYGRKYIQDDLIWSIGHGSIINDSDREFDVGRLNVPEPISHTLTFRPGEFLMAIWQEIMAMYRTIKQVDQVKLVIIDLDDTLWRGVVAEEGINNPMLTEGWPLGFAEALMFLKKRGTLLAIVSKNDETRIRELWPKIYGSRLELSDFAVIKINWQPKVNNVETILKKVNLLPKNVVFIDDNPVERDNVVSAFPEIRTLGASPYMMRRVLLWAPETQVARITDESAHRTEMVQAQVEREGMRTRLSRDEFLTSLTVKVRLFKVEDGEDSHFARIFELINKTNQFNTTGHRWAEDECQAFFSAGGGFWAFDVEDRFTPYGTVGVAAVLDREIRQFVMSCRVMGLDVEMAVISFLVHELSAGQKHEVRAAMVATQANHPCRELYAKCGFVETQAGWKTTAGPVVGTPRHVHVEAPSSQHWDGDGHNMRLAEQREQAAQLTAEAQAVAAVAARPEVPELYGDLGYALMAGRKAEQAVETFQRGLERAPDHPGLLFGLSHAFAWVGRAAEALAAAERASAMAPEQFHPLMHFGYLLTGAGLLDRAAAVFARAERLQPDDPRVPEALTDVLERLGRSEDALSAADRAVALAPQDESAVVRRATLYERLRAVARTAGEVAPAEEAVAWAAVHRSATQSPPMLGSPPHPLDLPTGSARSPGGQQ